MEIKEYLQELLDKWNKYDELDGFMADSFRTDLENLLEYWDLRIIEEPVRVFYSGDMCVGSSNKPKKQQKRKRKWWKDKSGNTHLEATSVNAVKPKRQDEWEKKLDKFFYEELGKGDHYIDVSWEDMDELVEKVKSFVGKLLSERQQKGWMEGFDEGTSLEKELSNLLKEEK